MYLHLIFSQQTFTCLKATMETLEKQCEISSKLSKSFRMEIERIKGEHLLASTVFGSDITLQI